MLNLLSSKNVTGNTLQETRAMNRSVLKRAEESHARSDATRIIKLSKTGAFVHHLPRSVRSFASLRSKHL